MSDQQMPPQPKPAQETKRDTKDTAPQPSAPVQFDDWASI